MNKSYRSIWNESLGAWVAASELTAARGKPGRSRLAAGAVAAAAMFATFALTPIAYANTFTSDQTCTGAFGGPGPGGAGPDGTVVPGSTNPTDGSGTFSAVAGCSASGGNNLGVSVYGSYASATGKGAAAFGMQSSAGILSVAMGYRSSAAGSNGVSVGYLSSTTEVEATAIGQKAAAWAGSVAIGSGASADQLSQT
ncbi:MAG: hypothetical protein EOO27_50810, partial [Comamonadaceae bacterium]